jgi:ketosteroid isomerase-like protein
MSELDPIAAYGAAWTESDPARRRELVDVAWAPDAVYCDPLDEVRGQQALADHIGATQSALAGGRIEVTTSPVRHHDAAFFRWGMTDAQGTTVLTGFDVVLLAADGRIARLTGFFDTDTGPAPSA